MSRRAKLATWLLLALVHFTVALVMLGLSSRQSEHELFSATEHGERVLRAYDAAVRILLLPVLTFQNHLRGWPSALALAINSLAYGGVVFVVINGVAKRLRRSRDAG